MVERNVLVSNLLSFLAATLGVMIGLLSRIPNAQKATSYDEGRLNAREGRQQYRVGDQNCDPPDKVIISPLVSRVKHSHLADCAAFRDCPMVKAAPVNLLKALSSARGCASNRGPPKSQPSRGHGVTSMF